jgi:hypothetical protein
VNAVVCSYQGEVGWREPGQAAGPYVIVTHFTSCFHLVQYAVYHVFERDQANIVNIESLLFSLKRKGATKQMKINNFLKKKKCKVDLMVDAITLVVHVDLINTYRQI